MQASICMYLIALYALLLYLLKLAFEFSLPLQSFLSSTHIQDFAIQLFAIHFSYCLPQREGKTSVSINLGYQHVSCSKLLNYPPSISVVFKVDKPKATRVSPFISHHTDTKCLTCEPEPTSDKRYRTYTFFMKSACLCIVDLGPYFI